jgi:hypothetical protein
MTAGDHRELLRHTLSTLAYRSAKVVRAAPEGFERFGAADTTRTPGQILAHMGDLMDWALSIASGAQAWRDATPLPWDQEVERFFQALGRFDAFLASGQELKAPAERLFQGPIADALTHAGQLAMLRRMAGSPVRGENYFVADISAGRVGPEQAKPRREFD